MKLKAADVQKMIGVEDDAIICHGYAPMMGDHERLTFDVFFRDGKLIRVGYNFEGVTREVWVSEFFQASFFKSNIKRWYEDTCNQKLLALMKTFDEYGLCTTPGGRLPAEVPSIEGVNPTVFGDD